MAEVCSDMREELGQNSSLGLGLNGAGVDLPTAVKTKEESLAGTPMHTHSLTNMDVDTKPLLNLKEEDTSPSQSPTLVDAPNHNCKTSASPTPPPTTTATGTPKSEATPPPTAPSRASKKAAAIPVQLIGHLPIARQEALSTFNEIRDNNYQYKTLGRSREVLESMSCDCTYDHGVDSTDNACGPYSDCINRLTQVECLSEDCRCKSYCQNQRFQRKAYANIEIVKTEMKGYGLRAEEDLPKDTFIYEYVGDVVNPVSFKKRMREYAEEGIQHFYFMMLQKDEFIDATKSGGIGRFANHSCNPNCYVAKWTVGDHVRMGIFAKRAIVKHEELTFNYNVDRYGHQAQECFCGEPMCVGYIGGKTQTEFAAMDDLYLDALGITDEEDVMELKGTKKKKGKKIDDPDFMPTMKPVVEKEVPKIIQAIRQTTSRKVLAKLLTRLKITEDQAALRQVMRLRGYSLMTNVLEDNASDLELITLALECMSTWPLLNQNKVQDSKVHIPVKACTELDNEAVKNLAQKLLDHWDTLPIYTRIPKRVIRDEDRIVVAPSPIFEVRPTELAQKQQRPQYVDHSWHSDIRRKRRNIERPFVPQPPQPPVQSLAEQRAAQAALAEAHNKYAEEQRQAKQNIKDVIAAAAEAAAQEEAAAAQAAAESKAAAAAEAEKAARRKERSAKKHLSPEEKEARKEKRLMKLVGDVVVKYMSKHASSLDHDSFKKYARELTSVIAEKEKKSSSYKTGKLEALSEEKVTKIKKFSKEYIAKVLRKLEKSGKKPRSSNVLPTPSTSTHTPSSHDGGDDAPSQAISMSVEEAMGMDPDSDDDEDMSTPADQQASPFTGSMAPPSGSQFHHVDDEAMIVDDDPLPNPSSMPSDPRRCPPRGTEFRK
ncbi:hypothetical protein CVT24_003307 [Panaeolus cyanescens]|uniref:Histone-lysine N-methyltransferase, H3 lysine-36 specific n=1 Tax=Panaeolus cyanescens TaxID=181874 RepID=A0A409Y6P3_9AGAR|nr:hypothetical protein CVT24_003307 [Panaeolus cyanescens]